MRGSESLEDYLETILMLSGRGTEIRGADVARALRFSRPSVSVAMKKLRESGMVDVDARGCIRLTDRGLAAAEPVYERHRVIALALMELGVSEATACADACRIEHAISEESYLAVKERLMRAREDRSAGG